MSLALGGSVVVLVGILAGCQGLPGSSVAARAEDDSAITAVVKTRLVAEKATNLTRVDIDTSGGTVYLSGAVDTEEQRARAEQFAWQAKGVKDVVNAFRVVHQR